MATPTTEITRSGSGSRPLNAGIAGASGYAGRELARLLAGHPQLSLRTAQARSEGFDELAPDELARCDVAFLCLPHGASHEFGEAVARAGTPVVDLGSDFRLDPGWAYGLTELFRADVLDSRQIANPGCYATAATLALAPLAEAGLLDAPIAIDGKSGVSGAGREPSERTHVSEVEGGVQPYTPTGHRHIAEIERSLERLAGELDDEAAELIAPCPAGAVLVLHSPPKGHCDSGGDGGHFGSPALLGDLNHLGFRRGCPFRSDARRRLQHELFALDDTGPGDQKRPLACADFE